MPWSWGWRRIRVRCRGEVEEERWLSQLEGAQDAALTGSELAALGDSAL